MGTHPGALSGGNIPDGRPGRKPARLVLEAGGVLWILNTGAQWHMLPQCCPNYKTVHRRFQTWSSDRAVLRPVQSPPAPTDAFVPAPLVIGTSHRPPASAPLTSLGLDVSRRLPQQPLVHGLTEKRSAGRKVVIVRSALARLTGPARPARLPRLAGSTRCKAWGSISVLELTRLHGSVFRPRRNRSTALCGTQPGEYRAGVVKVGDARFQAAGSGSP